MIRFLLLLPIKILGLLFMFIGSIIEHSEKQRIQAARIEEKRIAAAQKEEKTRRAAETFKKDQARIDLEHYLQQRRDLLKLYNELQKQYDATTAENRKETLYRKILALNNQLRVVDRTIERLQFTADRTG